VLGKRLTAVFVGVAALFVSVTAASAHPGHAMHGSSVAMTDLATILSPQSYLTEKAAAKSKPPATPVDIQFVNVSDWHGQVDPLNGVGGAGALSTYFKNERVANPNTITLTAGDAFGATPPLVSFFDEEPAVKAMNIMGFDADTLGNHNFDKGTEHLQRMVDLAEFPFVSSNLKNVWRELRGVYPLTFENRSGVKVAIVGVTNPEAPTLVFPGRFGEIEVVDPVKTSMLTAAVARLLGADVVVAITHMGVTGTDPVSGEAVGPLIDYAKAVRGFDVIFGDHTDVQFQGVINGALVHENKSKGVTYARTKLSVIPGKGFKRAQILSRSVEFVTPTAAAVTPDPAIDAMLAPYRTQLAALLDGQIGIATGLFPRGGTPAVERIGEAAIGNLVADALRTTYGTQIAYTNGGGLRDRLPSVYLPQNTALRRLAGPYAIGPPFDLVTGDVFAVLPFGNQSLTRTVTGAQLWAALEHSVSSLPSANGKFLQISGFKFSFSLSAAPGARVTSVTLNDGTAIPKDNTTYTATTNDFTNSGGDGYTMFADGQGVTRNLMANDVLAYITTAGTITPTIEGRITQLP
jgi:5'-nucleotidase